MLFCFRDSVPLGLEQGSLAACKIREMLPYPANLENEEILEWILKIFFSCFCSAIYIVTSIHCFKLCINRLKLNKPLYIVKPYVKTRFNKQYSLLHLQLNEIIISILSNFFFNY